MTDRNWDAEMAKIDRQLASVSDDQLLSRKSVATATNAGASSPSIAASAPVARSGRLDWGVAIRVTLAVALAAAIVFWPYPALCGLGLGGYLAATTAVVVAGVWSAVSAWRARAPRAHAASLIVILWGASLVAREVLPRVGYAKEVREWACK